MQLTIYYTDEDQYVLDKIVEEAKASRKSKSAVILTALEFYVERGRRLGEILCDMEKLKPSDLQKALQIQKTHPDRPMGEILVAEKMVRTQDLNRALIVQGKDI